LSIQKIQTSNQYTLPIQREPTSDIYCGSNAFTGSLSNQTNKLQKFNFISFLQSASFFPLVPFVDFNNVPIVVVFVWLSTAAWNPLIKTQTTADASTHKTKHIHSLIHLGNNLLTENDCQLHVHSNWMWCSSIWTSRIYIASSLDIYQYCLIQYNPRQNTNVNRTRWNARKLSTWLDQSDQRLSHTDRVCLTLARYIFIFFQICFNNKGRPKKKKRNPNDRYRKKEREERRRRKRINVQSIYVRYLISSCFTLTLVDFIHIQFS